MTIDINILYVDDDLIVVDKPTGLLSIADGYHPNTPHLYGCLSNTFSELYIVHRLDKETSGVIVFARNKNAHRSINQQFEKRLIKKYYLAWIAGRPEWDNYSIEIPLRVNGDRKHRTIPDKENGKNAITDIRVLEHAHQNTLVIAAPKTGYTHQIRSHLAAIQYPILFDSLYNPEYKPVPGNTKMIPDKRLMLHAFHISLSHPSSGEKLNFHCQIPQDFIHITHDPIEILEQFKNEF